MPTHPQSIPWHVSAWCVIFQFSNLPDVEGFTESSRRKSKQTIFALALQTPCISIFFVDGCRFRPSNYDADSLSSICFPTTTHALRPFSAEEATEVMVSARAIVARKQQQRKRTRARRAAKAAAKAFDLAARATERAAAAAEAARTARVAKAEGKAARAKARQVRFRAHEALATLMPPRGHEGVEKLFEGRNGTTA